MTPSLVAVNIELGHTARVLQHVTQEGFTHEWTVWVRGENDRSLADVVEKVVFTLHDSFKRPKRILKTPPFMITEKGYAGFYLPVQFFLQDKKQMRFEYDLVLQDLHELPITLTRCERLTFYNPQEELKRKLLAAGGVSLAPYARVAPLITPGAESRQQATGVATSQTRPPLPIPAPLTAPPNKTSERKKAKNESSSSTTAEKDQKVTDAFTELFGEPLKLYLPQTSAVKSKVPVTKAVSFRLASCNSSLGVSDPQVEGSCSFKSRDEELKNIRNTDKKIRTLKDVFKQLFGEDSDEEDEKSIRPCNEVNVCPAAANTSLDPRQCEPTVKVDHSSKPHYEDRTLFRDPKKRKLADIMKDLFGEDSDEEEVRSKRPRNDDIKTSEKLKCGKNYACKKPRRTVASSSRRLASPTKQEVLRAVFARKTYSSSTSQTFSLSVAPACALLPIPSSTPACVSFPSPATNVSPEQVAAQKEFSAVMVPSPAPNVSPAQVVAQKEFSAVVVPPPISANFSISSSSSSSSSSCSSSSSFSHSSSSSCLSSSSRSSSSFCSSSSPRLSSAVSPSGRLICPLTETRITSDVDEMKDTDLSDDDIWDSEEERLFEEGKAYVACTTMPNGEVLNPDHPDWHWNRGRVFYLRKCQPPLKRLRFDVFVGALRARQSGALGKKALSRVHNCLLACGVSAASSHQGAVVSWSRVPRPVLKEALAIFKQYRLFYGRGDYVLLK